LKRVARDARRERAARFGQIQIGDGKIVDRLRYVGEVGPIVLDGGVYHSTGRVNGGGAAKRGLWAAGACSPTT
jgi:hypothetical protein